MQRRQFLSSVAGGVAGGLPLMARGDAPEAPHVEPAAAAPSIQALEYGTSLFALTLDAVPGDTSAALIAASYGTPPDH